MKLSNLIKKENILFVESKEMEDTIDILINKAYIENKIKDIEEFKKAVLEREDIVSTGIGFGIAIPHSKLKSIKDFFLIIGVTKDGIDWDAIDRKPVRMVFLIGGPENKPKDYLKIVSRLILLIKNSKRRIELFNSETVEQIEKIFKEF